MSVHYSFHHPRNSLPQQRQQQQQHKDSIASSQQTIITSQKEGLFPPKIQDQVGLQYRQRLPEWDQSLLRYKKCRCPLDDNDGMKSSSSDKDNEEEEDDDVFSNLGEAAFAMLGSIWAEGGGDHNNNNIIPTSLLFPHANNNNHELWFGAQRQLEEDNTMDQQQQQQQHLGIRTRIREMLDTMTNHRPYNNNDADLESIATQVLQYLL